MTNPAVPPLILLIEDELPIRRFLRASLSVEGYRLEEVEALAQEARRRESVEQQVPIRHRNRGSQIRRRHFTCADPQLLRLKLLQVNRAR